MYMVDPDWRSSSYPNTRMIHHCRVRWVSLLPSLLLLHAATTCSAGQDDTGVFSSSGAIPFGGAIAKWSRGVVLNGIVYGMPSYARKVLIYKPSTNQIWSSATIPSNMVTHDGQWAGGVVVNDIIYGIPYFANRLLIYNPSTNQISSSATTPSGIDIGPRQWRGGVVVKGIIYGIPFDANKVLVYNPSTDQFSSSPTIPSDIDTGIYQ
jgi:hypothetical protein